MSAPIRKDEPIFSTMGNVYGFSSSIADENLDAIIRQSFHQPRQTEIPSSGNAPTLEPHIMDTVIKSCKKAAVYYDYKKEYMTTAIWDVSKTLERKGVYLKILLSQNESEKLLNDTLTKIMDEHNSSQQ